MSKRLKIRTLKLEKLPYGRYKFIAYIKQGTNNLKYAKANRKYTEPIKDMLANSAIGSWRLDHISNYKRNKVYNKLYLTDKMDLALVKLCYASLLHKIYEIELKSTALTYKE